MTTGACYDFYWFLEYSEKKKKIVTSPCGVTTFLGQGQVLVRMMEYICWNVTLCITKINVSYFYQNTDRLQQDCQLLMSNALDNKLICIHKPLVRDSSAIQRLFVRLAGAVGRRSTLHKENSGFATPTLGRHISMFRGYQILFSIRNSYINRFTNHFSIHS